MTKVNRPKTAEELLGTTIKAKVKLFRYIYPQSWKDPQWGVVKVKIDELIDGELPDELGWDGYISVVGHLPVMEFREQYVFIGQLVYNPKYGYQYSVMSLHGDYNFESIEDQKKFLSFALTDHQIETVFATLENPMQVIRDRDVATLRKVKGVGPKTAEKIIKKYFDNEEYALAAVGLDKYGLTEGAIKKIVEAFKTPEAAIKAIEENPYVLIEKVRGYGWNKADKAARNAGLAANDPRRARAYACYYLDERGESVGDSWAIIDDVLSATQAMCAPMSDETVVAAVKAMIRTKDNPDGELYYEPETRRISLVDNYNIEKELADHFHRLMKGDPYVKFTHEEIEQSITSAEREVGFQYTDEQKDAIYKMAESPMSILTGRAGCVDCDTEFFNGIEWKKISDYNENDKVLIYHPDGTATLETPERYIKLPETHLWEVETKYGLSMCLCPEHNVYYITSKGNLYHKTFAEIKEQHERLYSGFCGKFITSFNYGGSGIDLSDAEIKVMLAVIADGYFPKEDNRCILHFKKERKIIEAEKILQEAHINYKKHGPNGAGYTDFVFYAPRREKEFSEYWYNCSHDQLKLICDNVLKWDGSVSETRKSFSSTIKATADFIQFAFAACGYKATLLTYDRRGQFRGKYERLSIEYNVAITSRNLISMGGFHREKIDSKPQILPYTTKDGYKYCFTVSSHMWIMRRHGKIVITGNCGKSFSTNAVYKLFESKGLKIATCALSGRASSKLTEITHKPGQTIHKLLGASGQNKFAYNAETQLPIDVLIIDECTLIGAQVFLYLLRAVKTGTRVIMLGDTHQLEPIGLGNVFADLLKAQKIPTTVLTKIHRQAAASGIITESLRVSNGEQLFDSAWAGQEIRGELKDFKLDIVHDNALVYADLMNEFKLLLNSGVPSNDIQILVPLKDRGNVCCKTLNAQVQSIVNPKTYPNQVEVRSVPDRSEEDGSPIPGTGTPIILKPNDRIIIMQNTYKGITNHEHEDVAVFNGNVGYIKEIEEKYMWVHLTEQGDVKIPQKHWGIIALGYAITVHKKQGDSSPYVIFALDSSAYTLLSKELIYTAITRARKYCTVVATNSVFRKAVTISRVRIKQTWLQFLL